MLAFSPNDTEMWRESTLSQKVRMSVDSNGIFETMATP